MRGMLYLIVIINVLIGFILLYRKPNPFKGKTYADHVKYQTDEEDIGDDI